MNDLTVFLNKNKFVFPIFQWMRQREAVVVKEIYNVITYINKYSLFHKT